MNHLPILPVLVAAVAGFALVLLASAPLRVQRIVSLAATAAGLVIAVMAVTSVTDGTPLVYRLGDWPAPYGIVLVLDRLSAMMVLLTAVLAALAILQAVQGTDERGRLFHAIFQFQLMGVYGAFLTGDIFNLFVFFEILLIASYGLLLHGRGPERARAAVKYVVVNLTGSALFLIGVGALYSVTGTLNMADLADQAQSLPAADLGLFYVSAFVLLVVFATKAALVPLSLWLPDAYASATAPVAALFAIMTKVGVYAILRVYTIAFDAPASAVAAAVMPWLLGAALVTMLLGMIGALAAQRLRGLIAYTLISSVGTMLAAIALFTPTSVAAGLYYLVHSTLAAAGMYLLTDLLAPLRGDVDDRLHPGPRPGGWATMGLLFMGLAVAVAGLPPLSGFLGKALILQASLDGAVAPWLWAVILFTSLLAVVALSRAASTLFWKDDPPARTPAPAGAAYVPTGLCLALIVLLTVFAAPIQRYTAATAGDLLTPNAYVNAVLGEAAAGDEEV